MDRNLQPMPLTKGGKWGGGRSFCGTAMTTMQMHITSTGSDALPLDHEGMGPTMDATGGKAQHKGLTVKFTSTRVGPSADSLASSLPLCAASSSQYPLKANDDVQTVHPLPHLTQPLTPAHSTSA